MAQFSKIIGAVLNDILRAQYEANRYAECLRVPRATIGDIELNFNYGIADATSECEVHEIDYRRLHAFLKDFAFRTAKVVIATVIASVKPNNVMGNNEAFRVWSQLSEEGGKGHRKLLAFLSRKMHGELVDAAEGFLDEHGSLKAEPLVTALCDVARGHLLSLPEVDALFPGNGVEGGEKLMRSLSAALSPVVLRMVSARNFATRRLVASADVVVDARSLEKIPAECIHSIRLQVSLPDELPAIEPDKNARL